MMKALNCNFVSASTFTRLQSLYLVPSINDLWGEMEDSIWRL